MPTQDDCRKKILQLWRRWYKGAGQATYQDKQEFYMMLGREHPESLDFKVSRGNDKWQVVHGWLNREG
jgi:hypothetical protein